MPEVSVVMAVYNGMPYLPQAIDSILGQTLTDFEFIIINDCSTDQTPQVLASYQDARLRVVNLEKNGGQTAALNLGLRLASAPYIARQDADDVSKPERLAQQIEFLNANPAYLLIGTAGDLIDDVGNITGQVIHPTSYEAVLATFQNDNCLFHGSVMFRREVLETIGYYREGFRNSQDFDYWLRIAEVGKMLNLPEPLYQYRLHEGQMTFTSYYRMKAEWQLALKLAEVRKNGQADAEEYEMGAADLKKRFANFIPTPAEKRRALAELWRGKGVSYMNSRRYLPMLYCLGRAFFYEPNNPQFWQGVRNHLPKFS